MTITPSALAMRHFKISLSVVQSPIFGSGEKLKYLIVNKGTTDERNVSIYGDLVEAHPAWNDEYYRGEGPKKDRFFVAHFPPGEKPPTVDQSVTDEAGRTYLVRNIWDATDPTQAPGKRAMLEAVKLGVSYSEK
jgi:hypothetical protein